jgi:hypothetical protein
MTGLLEFREKIRQIYIKSEAFLIPIAKFFVAFLALNLINGKLGYMSEIDNIAIVLMVALLCSFLPNVCIILFAAIFCLLHLYALSLEALVIGLCLFLIMFLLFFRFSPKSILAVLLTPILFAWKVPYIIPIVLGLTGTPAAAVSMICGIIVYYFVEVIAGNAATISTMDADEVTAKFRLLIDGLLENKTMLVVIVAFTVTVIAVYFIRRMSIDYSWTIAMIAGVILNLVVLLAGDLLYDTKTSLAGAVLGSLLAIVCAKILEFFRFCVDYNRTEKVQFEDDEYYYYVKAVPKMAVAAQTKTVKKINTKSYAGTTYAGETDTDRLPPRSRQVMTETTAGRLESSRRNVTVTRNQRVTIANTGRGDDREDFDEFE